MTSDLADYSVIVFERTGYDTYACRALILALLHRHMRDLHNAARRDCALRWFESGTARAYCGLIRAAGASSRWEENHHREIHGNQSDIHRRE